MKTDRTIALKVCGMREAANIADVAALAPAYLGFIFYDKSPRYVGRDFVMPGLGANIRKVGVFVDQPVEVILGLATTYGLDYAQLHGNEPPEAGAALRSAGVGVIKAFAVDGQFDFEVTAPYAPVADYFLFDTKGRFRGGNGVPFDWNVLRRYQYKVPFFLSGGLTPLNAREAVELDIAALHALDVNSGVEASPGVKRIEDVRRVALLLEEKLNEKKRS